MTRRTRTVAVFGVATASALAASLFVYAASRDSGDQIATVDRVESVVLAARPLPLGAVIRPEDVKLVAWPSGSRVPGSHSRGEAVVGRALTAAVAENEPITDTKLAQAGAISGLSHAIPPGMRAISVKVDDVIGVGGFVVPGTRVDVIAAVRGHEERVGRVVVSNVEVLTVGTRNDQDKAGAVALGRDAETVATLAVSPSAAEAIALASAEGRITLALRNPLDNESAPTAGVGLRNLAGGTQEAASTRTLPRGSAGPSSRRAAPNVSGVAPVNPEPGHYVVEIIRAGKRSSEVIR